jgi:hypothetical protein
VYLPSVEIGGGERAALEALACGAAVMVEPDNAKLVGLLQAQSRPGSKRWDQFYYANQLAQGVEWARGGG